MCACLPLPTTTSKSARLSEGKYDKKIVDGVDQFPNMKLTIIIE